MGVSHTHGVWAAALGSVHVVCYVPGICLSCVFTAHESLGEKTDNIYQYVCTRYKIRPLVPKPGKSSCPLPPGKKTLSARHELQSARMAPRPRPMCSAGLHVSVYLLFCRKVLVRREKLAKVRKIDKPTYTYSKYIPGIYFKHMNIYFIYVRMYQVRAHHPGRKCKDSSCLYIDT